jgi:hypothetical protein
MLPLLDHAQRYFGLMQYGPIPLNRADGFGHGSSALARQDHSLHPGLCPTWQNKFLADMVRRFGQLAFSGQHPIGYAPHWTLLLSFLELFWITLDLS